MSDVHFPSPRVGFTWCGKPIEIPPNEPVRDDVSTSIDGLRYATDVVFVTCAGCKTDVPATSREDSLWFEDCDGPRLFVGDRGEWISFAMHPEKARAWAKVLTDFADRRPVPSGPADETRAPYVYRRPVWCRHGKTWDKDCGDCEAGR